ncbi:hypothetical protein [Bradyrhizobium manausense]|uniref:hypothetical protein n=1 Tax=Bradyrhizobium manausense TaxID=989370 RepID=UPI001BA8DF3F|nr:hypothetical protein [Bradyrhizobium manausense]MBR0725524.1 hypothetical protein [Bradyrhizobium manausense]
MDVDAANWVGILDDCIALDPRIVVPGHGAIRDRGILVDIRDCITDIAARVAEGLPNAKDDEEFAVRLMPEITAVHPDWHAPEWIGSAIRYFAPR